ncbi:MAG TPA: hypothetical protein VKH19_08605 [Gemmatimonadaceae bacterium]|nr:hypothetical protein [Gemmatimonadaceae bacterium]
MNSRIRDIAGLRTIEVAGGDDSLVVVLLHGYAMTPEDLAPFAASMGVPARFLFPEGPSSAMPAGRAWWPIDPETRARALAAGPRDLAHEHPEGAPRARAMMLAFLDAIAPSDRLVLGGFSQGAMLVCDVLFRDAPRVDALALLSPSRISVDDWLPHVSRAKGLPVLVSHGTHDADLAFSTGEAVRDLFINAGARVTWTPFDGGHEIPLPVWRALRKFLTQTLRATK